MLVSRSAFRPAVVSPAIGSFGQQTRNMATLKEIQIRLKSIQNIGKITKSMKMIASTKLNRAQRAMENAKKYGETSNAVFKVIEPKLPESGVKTLLIPCTSDRGLCGAIHSTVSKPTKAEVRKNPDSTILAVVGDKCRTQIVREARKNMVMSFNGIGKNIPTFSEAASIAEAILAGKFEFNVGYVLYNRFKSVIAYELAKTPVYTEQAIQSSDKLAAYELEDDVLANFVEFSLANAVFHALAEGHASEMAARRTAMENATKNAGEIIQALTMKYNRTRQAAITNDLVDIITGASAL